MADSGKQKAKTTSLYAELTVPEQVEDALFTFSWELFND